MQNLYPPHRQNTNSPAPSTQTRTKAKAPPPPSPLLNPQHAPPPAAVQARTKAMAPAPPVPYSETAPLHVKMKAAAPPPPIPEQQQLPVTNRLASSLPSFNASPSPPVPQGALGPDLNSEEMVIQELPELSFFWVSSFLKKIFPGIFHFLCACHAQALRIASCLGFFG